MRVDWILLDVAETGALEIGDLVSAEAGGLPTYRVMARDADRLWLRDEAKGMDCISPLSRFPWKACPIA